MGTSMTPADAVAELDAMDPPQEGSDWVYHSDADEILLALVPPEVADAYQRLQDRCLYWVFA